MLLSFAPFPSLSYRVPSPLLSLLLLLLIVVIGLFFFGRAPFRISSSLVFLASFVFDASVVVYVVQYPRHCCLSLMMQAPSARLLLRILLLLLLISLLVMRVNNGFRKRWTRVYSCSLSTWVENSLLERYLSIPMCTHVVSGCRVSVCA